MTTRENPDAAPPVNIAKPATTAAEPRESESLATAPEPVLLENPRAVAAAPSESMEGVVTVERSLIEREGAAPALELEPVTAPIGPAPDVESTVTLENPNAPTPAPSEGTEDVITLEASPPPPPPVVSEPAAPPQAVRVLPRRPRLRATFHYDAGDELNVELTLMDDWRELIHRMALKPAPGGAIARIFEALLGVVTQSAAAAGVFGSRER